MKKVVCLFGAILIFSNPQINLAQNYEESLSYDLSGNDNNEKNKDHKKFNFGPIKVGLDFNYLRSTSVYDADGNKQNSYGGDIFTRSNEIIYGRYSGGRLNLGNSKLHWGVSGEFSVIQEKLTPGDQNPYGVGHSDNGFVFTPGLDIGTRRLGGIRLGTYFALKYQFDGTKNESNATDKQNALGANLNFNYRFSHGLKVYAGINYWETFKGQEKQQIYNYQTNQIEEMTVNYDQGNQFAIYGGGDYKWCWGDCGWGYVDLKFNYWNRAEQSFNGNTINNSGANYFSANPTIGFRWKKVPLSVSLTPGYKNEYGIEQGMIGFSGKNILKPSIAGEINVKYRF